MCIHGRQKRYCRECKGSAFCVHDRRKSRCKDCGGAEICSHSRNKYECKDCGGSQICPHNRIRSTCHDCNGSQICQHDRRRSQCKECEGSSQICQHDRQRSTCHDCGGSQICQHDHLRSTCRDCKGSQICQHDHLRSKCRDCEGGSICQHDRQRPTCKDCKGSQICQHDRFRSVCSICDPPIHPQNWCQSCQYIKMTYRSPYKPFCFDCYCALNPDADIPRQRKLKEHHLRDAIIEKFPDYQVVWDKKIDNGCSRRRPDGRLECFTHSIVIECDEHQHQGYTCESKRIMELFQDLGNRPLVVIRFNPDGYSQDGKTFPSCFTKLKTTDNSINKTEWNRRIAFFLETLEYHHKQVPEKELTVVELFYSKHEKLKMSPPKIKVV